MAFWRAHGGTLFGWQESAIDGMLGLGEDERWASTNDGLTVARQNGKGVVLQAIEVFFAFELGYPLVMHTAHEFATSQEHQLRLEAFIQDAPELHAKVRDRGGYVHANGQESIRLKSGCRIGFKARTKGGGRGYSGDLLVWDEAMVIPQAVVGAQKPMLRASQALHGPKTIYAGSAVDQEIHEHGLAFALIRERGMSGAPGVSYHEWSAPFASLAEMTDEVLRDRSWWPLANPSMPEGLIAESHMADEIESMPARTAAVELGCVGDWPSTTGQEDQVISVEDWSALIDKRSSIVGPVAFALDVSPDRSRASISAAGRRADERFHVETVERVAGGTGWVAPRLRELVERHSPVAVVLDNVGPAGSLLPELEQAGVKVTVVSAAQHAHACGVIYDMVEQDRLRHLGTSDLLDAIKGATSRPLGDRWAWNRRSSAVDITPLVAGTLALWAAAGHVPRPEPWAASW